MELNRMFVVDAPEHVVRERADMFMGELGYSLVGNRQLTYSRRSIRQLINLMGASPRAIPARGQLATSLDSGGTLVAAIVRLSVSGSTLAPSDLRLFATELDSLEEALNGRSYSLSLLDEIDRDAISKSNAISIAGYQVTAAILAYGIVFVAVVALLPRSIGSGGMLAVIVLFLGIPWLYVRSRSRRNKTSL